MSRLLAILQFTLLFTYYVLEAIVLALTPSRFRQKKNVQGQIVLITGAGGVIGRHLAQGFAKLGAKVVCWDVAKRANEETAELITTSGGEAFAYHVDLRNREDVYRKAELVKREVGKVTILVNNAGVLTANNLLDTSDDDIVRTIEVNTLAHFWTVKSFLGDMIAGKKGHIVTVSSMAGLFGANCLIDYCASKFASYGFDDALQVELRVNGHEEVKTTVICPYFVKTPLTHGVVESKLLETIPQLEPEYVANRILESVLNEEKVVYIPSSLSVLVLLKAILPAKANNALGDFLGAKDGLKLPKKD